MRTSQKVKLGTLSTSAVSAAKGEKMEMMSTTGMTKSDRIFLPLRPEKVDVMGDARMHDVVPPCTVRTTLEKPCAME